MTQRSDRSEQEVASLLAQLRVDPGDDGFGAGLSARLAAAGHSLRTEALQAEALQAEALRAEKEALVTVATTEVSGIALDLQREPLLPADGEVRALLAQLRVDPPEDGFRASLSSRLAAVAEAKAPVASTELSGSLVGRLFALFRTTARVPARAPAWMIGSCSGALAGAAMFALLQMTQGATPVMQGVTPVTQGAGRQDPDLLAEAHDNAGLNRSVGSRAGGASGALCPPAAQVAQVEVFALPAGKVALVHLQFDVEQDVEAAEFSVLLPPGLSFYSEGEALPERVFRWQAPLSAGANQVPVAILGIAPGQHRVTATATVGSEVVVHELVLDVQGAA